MDGILNSHYCLEILLGRPLSSLRVVVLLVLTGVVLSGVVFWVTRRKLQV